MPYSKSLRVTRDQYAYMQDAIKAALAKLPADKVATVKAGVSPVNFAWQLFRLANLTSYACDVLYPAGVIDANIRAALLRIATDNT